MALLKYSRLSLTWLVAIAIFLVGSPIESGAQSLDLRLGVRGGLTSSISPIEVSSNHYFPPSYSASSSPGTFGATAGVVVDDRVEFRVEAVRYRFHLEGKSGTPYPASSIKWTSVTDGHVWQYPILFTYRISSGSIRTFVGGGLTFSRTVKGTTTTETTTISPTSVETTTTSTRPFRPAGGSPIAINPTVGFELRKGWISLRPEMRLGFWSGYRSDTENQAVFSSPQAELIVGIQLHPFRLR